jgi:hypothetical protein
MIRSCGLMRCGLHGVWYKAGGWHGICHCGATYRLLHRRVCLSAWIRPAVQCRSFVAHKLLIGTHLLINMHATAYGTITGFHGQWPLCIDSIPTPARPHPTYCIRLTLIRRPGECAASTAGGQRVRTSTIAFSCSSPPVSFPPDPVVSHPPCPPDIYPLTHPFFPLPTHTHIHVRSMITTHDHTSFMQTSKESRLLSRLWVT